VATTLFHCCPAENRDSILEHGLDIRHGRRMFLPEDLDPAEEAKERWDWDKHDWQAHYPPAVYLFDGRQAAIDYGRFHFFESDVWRVDMSGLHLALDRDLDGSPCGRSPYGAYAYFTFDVVPTERLELVERSLGDIYEIIDYQARLAAHAG
jgi:hypothetical protein